MRLVVGGWRLCEVEEKIRRLWLRGCLPLNGQARSVVTLPEYDLYALYCPALRKAEMQAHRSCCPPLAALIIVLLHWLLNKGRCRRRLSV